jgi:hypothetical protein
MRPSSPQIGSSQRTSNQSLSAANRTQRLKKTEKIVQTKVIKMKLRQDTFGIASSIYENITTQRLISYKFFDKNSKYIYSKDKYSTLVTDIRTKILALTPFGLTDEKHNQLIQLLLDMTGTNNTGSFQNGDNLIQNDLLKKINSFMSNLRFSGGLVFDQK